MWTLGVETRGAEDEKKKRGRGAEAGKRGLEECERGDRRSKDGVSAGSWRGTGERHMQASVQDEGGTGGAQNGK